jgi:uncharacterized protein
MSDSILGRLLSSQKEDALASDVRVCAFFTAVVSRNMGLASTLRRFPHLGTGPPVPRAGLLVPASARDLASLALSSSLIEASIGLAALNSMIEIDSRCLVDRNAGDLISERGRGRPVAVVGDFPFVRKLRGTTSELWVFEQGSKVRRGTLAEDQMPAILPRAEVAAISSTTLLNHSLDRILDYLDPDCFTILVGPSTPLSPVLLDLGFDALCGSVVVDRERALASLSQGATFRQVRGVKHVVMRLSSF